MFSSVYVSGREIKEAVFSATAIVQRRDRLVPLDDSELDKEFLKLFLHNMQTPIAILAINRLLRDLGVTIINVSLNPNFLTPASLSMPQQFILLPDTSTILPEKPCVILYASAPDSETAHVIAYAPLRLDPPPESAITIALFTIN